MIKVESAIPKNCHWERMRTINEKTDNVGRQREVHSQKNANVTNANLSNTKFFFCMSFFRSFVCNEALVISQKPAIKPFLRGRLYVHQGKDV